MNDALGCYTDSFRGMIYKFHFGYVLVKKVSFFLFLFMLFVSSSFVLYLLFLETQVNWLL